MSISIAGLYEDAVATSQAGDAITQIVLRLSEPPSEDWIEAFHHEWALTSYPRKRSARIGTVRIPGSVAIRRGLLLSSSPQDFVDKHKRHLEDAVLRANDRMQQRDRQRDMTIAEAAQVIREINRAHYGDAPGADGAAGAPLVRLAV